MQKVNSKSQLAIVLLLVGGFVLGFTMLPNAIGDPVPDFDWAGDPANLSQEMDNTINEEDGTGSAYASISGDRLDDDGNVVGTVYVSAGADLNAGDGVVSYWAYGFSGVYGCDDNQMPHTGDANAWAKVPTKFTMHDSGGPGNNLVNACCDSYMQAYDHITLGFIGLGNRVLKASAAISVHSHGPRISVQLTVTGV